MAAVRLQPSKETKIAALTRERDEALKREKATAEVLGVISAPSAELEPVFQTILQNATRICGAKFGALMLSEGDGLRGVAFHNAPPAFSQAMSSIFTPPPFTAIARAATTRQAAQIVDIAATPGYAEANPFVLTATDLGGFRTVLSVPMLRKNDLIGIISIFRQQVEEFTDEQIELVSHFAKQAVIAIENTRLLNELRKSLEQQTATSQVLSVISSSPGELEPVFQAMLENATRICEAKFGLLLRFDGKAFELAAEIGTPPELGEYLRQRGPFQPVPGSHLARLMQTKLVSHTADYAADGVLSPPVKFGGARSTVDVPMLKDDELIGAFSIYRQEVRPFTDKQIELVQNFAAQAVIAIENTRLLNELRQRTDDLTESLEQQTATAEVLQAISSTPGELNSVFGAMLTNAIKICRAQFGNLLLYDGDQFQRVALRGVPADFAKSWLEGLRPSSYSALGQLLSTKQVVHVPDARADQAYAERDPLRVATVEILRARTFLAVPMLKDDKVIGAITIYRQEVLPFTDKQIELVQNFAAQAVIAIENTRLLSELRNLYSSKLQPPTY